MTARKKLIVSIASLAIVLVVAAAAVGITLAALSGSVTSGFTIKYSALNVKATVSAQYQIGSATAVDFKDGQKTSIQFQGNEAQGTATGNLTAPNDIVLTATDRVVTITYTFTNDWTSSDADKNNFTLHLNNPNNLVPSSVADLSVEYAVTFTTETGSNVSKAAYTGTFNDLTVKVGDTCAVTFTYTLAQNSVTTFSFPVTGISWDLTGVTAAA